MPTINEIRIKLESEGKEGLFYPGECACTIDDLAPCGECEHTPGEDYINDCDGGYKHSDPKNPDFFVVSASKEPPSEDEWDAYRSLY